MADNVEITAGTGTSVAADEVGGAYYQRVKVSVGADGAAADLAPGQALSTASLPVVLASDHSDVKVTLDSEAVVLGAGAAAIGKLAANSGVDIGDVDVTSVPAPLSTTGGGTATIKFRDHADTKDRITATVDVDGNRTLVVVDGS